MRWPPRSDPCARGRRTLTGESRRCRTSACPRPVAGPGAKPTLFPEWAPRPNAAPLRWGGGGEAGRTPGRPPVGGWRRRALRCGRPRQACESARTADAVPAPVSSPSAHVSMAYVTGRTRTPLPGPIRRSRVQRSGQQPGWLGPARVGRRSGRHWSGHAAVLWEAHRDASLSRPCAAESGRPGSRAAFADPGAGPRPGTGAAAAAGSAARPRPAAARPRADPAPAGPGPDTGTGAAARPRVTRPDGRGAAEGAVSRSPRNGRRPRACGTYPRGRPCDRCVRRRSRAGPG